MRTLVTGVSLLLFTRDLRVHDNPALAAACADGGEVLPVFVRDPAVPGSPVRNRFLAECLTDLAASLRARGGDLVFRTGDPVRETMRLVEAVGAGRVVLADDASGYARRRADRLRAAARTRGVDVSLFPGVTVVPPLVLAPATGDHYRIFTPYWRAWQAASWRPQAPTPRRVRLPAGYEPGAGPPAAGAPVVIDAVPGGERAARRRLARWRGGAAGYADGHDDLPGDRTSRLSPYLHFGCVSPRDVVSMVDFVPEFVRQVCWRDFYTQVLAAFPRLGSDAYRFSEPDRRAALDAGTARAGGAGGGTAGARSALDAWRHGVTGLPIVDAGMRQLIAEGWMHNRARLITATFLCRHLDADWRAGAAVFDGLLLDADVANNNGNWQWVAGTGTDTRRNRGFNPIRQAERFDPAGDYVRRYVPELAGIPGSAVHRPWRLGPPWRSGRPARGYPTRPLVGSAQPGWL